MKIIRRSLLLLTIISLSLFTTIGAISGKNPPKTGAGLKRYLYVITPGIRNYLGYGGHGVHLFDIDQNYRHVRFIPGLGGRKPDGTPSNVKGVDVSLWRQTACISVRTKPCNESI